MDVVCRYKINAVLRAFLSFSLLVRYLRWLGLKRLHPQIVKEVQH